MTLVRHFLWASYATSLLCFWAYTWIPTWTKDICMNQRSLLLILCNLIHCFSWALGRFLIYNNSSSHKNNIDCFDINENTSKTIYPTHGTQCSLTQDRFYGGLQYSGVCSLGMSGDCGWLLSSLCIILVNNSSTSMIYSFLNIWMHADIATLTILYYANDQYKSNAFINNHT